ncbi:hypothetical protein HAZT_HAZT003535 [Hyalella azteca]|uniref:RNA helicase n=1 Tax=Hyalella azteca TaxID=294128 RepID=A0A6A0H1J7_HYAAZ|nr:hypothetical protein HAZT_HAZT003535 [Hyalella azteca]
MAIPTGRCGLDLIVQAKSGTGKTCVFTVIALEMIATSAPTCQVLVVTPTREIAVQVTSVINNIGRHISGLCVQTFIGGTAVENLVNCHIAVGTPGRLHHLLSAGVLPPKNIRLLVLDEADQLLDSFRNVVLQIVAALPLNKQIICTSATYTPSLQDLAKKMMRSASHISLGAKQLLAVTQYVHKLPYTDNFDQTFKAKLLHLKGILGSVVFNQCLIFTNSINRCESVHDSLLRDGWPVARLCGGQTQQERLKALDDLVTHRCRVMVATDLAARGLDSPHVSLVVSMEPPPHPHTYLHRVGRAGRFGSVGRSIVLASQGDDWLHVQAIATVLDLTLIVLPMPSLEDEHKYKERLPHLSPEQLKQWTLSTSHRLTYTSTVNGGTYDPLEVWKTTSSDGSHITPSEVPHTSPTEVSHASLTEVSHASLTEVSRASPTEVSHASPTEVSQASPTEVSHASPVEVSHASHAQVSPVTFTKMSHASIADLSHIDSNDVSEVRFQDVSRTPSSNFSHGTISDLSTTICAIESDVTPSTKNERIREELPLTETRNNKSISDGLLRTSAMVPIPFKSNFSFNSILDEVKALNLSEDENNSTKEEVIVGCIAEDLTEEASAQLRTSLREQKLRHSALLRRIDDQWQDLTIQPDKALQALMSGRSGNDLLAQLKREKFACEQLKKEDAALEATVSAVSEPPEQNNEEFKFHLGMISNEKYRAKLDKKRQQIRSRRSENDSCESKNHHADFVEAENTKSTKRHCYKESNFEPIVLLDRSGATLKRSKKSKNAKGSEKESNVHSDKYFEYRDSKPSRSIYTDKRSTKSKYKCEIEGCPNDAVLSDTESCSSSVMSQENYRNGRHKRDRRREGLSCPLCERERLAEPVYNSILDSYRKFALMNHYVTYMGRTSAIIARHARQEEKKDIVSRPKPR